MSTVTSDPVRFSRLPTTLYHVHKRLSQSPTSYSLDSFRSQPILGRASLVSRRPIKTNPHSTSSRSPASRVSRPVIKEKEVRPSTESDVSRLCEELNKFVSSFPHSFTQRRGKSFLLGRTRSHLTSSSRRKKESTPK